MRCGVVCFSPCLQSVLLVKTEEFSWTFPYAKISSSSFPAANLEGAIATLKHLTGVQLNDADLQANRWIQVGHSRRGIAWTHDDCVTMHATSRHGAHAGGW